MLTLGVLPLLVDTQKLSFREGQVIQLASFQFIHLLVAWRTSSKVAVGACAYSICKKLILMNLL